MARTQTKRRPRTAIEDMPDLSPTTSPATGAALAIELDGIVHVLTCGSVDDGKSTLIGRLLWDSTDLPEDTRATIARSAGADGIPDVSLLVDGLLAEREQGITIDIAWRFVDAHARRIVIIDSPGHEQYTRNMASGASHADIAVMLVDARDGLKVQTRRHAAILDLVGVRHVVLAVNKMDLVGWDEARFRAIERDFLDLATTFGFQDTRAIPVSAKLGDNVAQRSARMAWYTGPTLLERLSAAPSRAVVDAGAFRFPVQTVVRAEPDFRGLAGTVVSGQIAVGDTVVDAVSGRRAAVTRIVTMDGDRSTAGASRAVVLVLDTNLDLSRGAVLCAPGSVIEPAASLDTRLVWLADTPFDASRGLLLRTATDLVPVQTMTVTARLDLASLVALPDARCETNDIVLATLDLGRVAALDRFRDLPVTGAFVLVDTVTGATVAGGVVTERHVAAVRAPAGPAYELTVAVLAEGVCAGLEPEDPEFRRRAIEVQKLLRAAGVVARLAPRLERDGD
jgi:bifunctional enzyme CysN/CysC